jgi:hypothetical protein
VLLARVLQHLLTLGGSCPVPLLAQHLPPLGWQLLKAVEVLPHCFPLIRRQGLEALPALTQRLSLLGRERPKA